MVRYIEKITGIVPFVNDRREELKLPKSQHALAIFDCFKGQTTPKVKALLDKHHMRAVIVPANCTDKLQPLDTFINKPFKDEKEKRFQLWYASEVCELLNESKSVKVDVSAAAIKHTSATWIISTWRELKDALAFPLMDSEKPELWMPFHLFLVNMHTSQKIWTTLLLIHGCVITQ